MNEQEQKVYSDKLNCEQNAALARYEGLLRYGACKPGSLRGR